jgi:hypothetical protein
MPLHDFVIYKNRTIDVVAPRRQILSIANNLLNRAAPVNRILRGFMACLVVLQLFSGMGVVRFMPSAHDTDSSYAASKVFAQGGISNDDISAFGLLGDDGPDDDEPLLGTPIIFNTHRPSIPAEGQVAFGLPRSTVNRAVHPTGPPSLS